MTNNRKAFLIVSTIVVLGISCFGAYSLTKYILNPAIPDQDKPQESTAPTTKPVDAQSYCPFNGKKYTVDDQLRWEAKHPVGVMIENHPDARPQSGLSSADVVYEAVAEGGITRFLAMFLCDPAPQLVGPVRSARTYFLDWLSEYDAFYAHVGGANSDGPADALQQIKDYGIKDFEGLSEDIKQGWQRDRNRIPDVSLEHTMYLDIERLRKFAKDTWNWDAKINNIRWDSTFEKWKFKDEKAPYQAVEATAAATVSYKFWDGSEHMFGISWNYNPDNKTYLRTMGGRPHIDNNTQKQIEVSNVIIMIQEQSSADDEYHDNLHLLYKTIGSGNAWVINNGQAEHAKWSKSGRTARTKFLNVDGEEIPLERGKIWISIVPSFSEEDIIIK